MSDIRRVFTLTEDHLKLLKRTWVSWNYCETGAPQIDPKRPYGNSYVPADVVEILGWEPEYEDPENPFHLTDKQYHMAMKLHEETTTALQIVLSTGSFEPGEYIQEGFEYRAWRRR